MNSLGFNSTYARYFNYIFLLIFLLFIGFFSLFVIKVDVDMNAYESLRAGVLLPNLYVVFHCPVSNKSGPQISKINEFLINHGFESRVSFYEINAIDNQKRFVDVKFGTSTQSNAVLSYFFEPLRERNVPFENEILFLITKRLGCSIVNQKSYTNSPYAKGFYDYDFYKIKELF